MKPDVNIENWKFCFWITIILLICDPHIYPLGARGPDFDNAYPTTLTVASLFKGQLIYDLADSSGLILVSYFVVDGNHTDPNC